MLDIANESRYDQYDLTIEKPKPLVPRALRLTVPERVDVHGAVRLPLDEAAVRGPGAVPARRSASRASRSRFLHSYVNPAHERRTREILQAELPGLWVTLSSEVCPEVREYERTTTTVANAYVQPLMDGYLGRMQAALKDEGFGGTIYLDHLGRRPDGDRDGAQVSGAAGRIRPGRRRDLRGAGRGRAPARAACCPSTWAAPPPRSA